MNYATFMLRNYRARARLNPYLQETRRDEFELKNALRFLALGSTALLATSLMVGCSASDGQEEQVSELTLYSGRSEEFIAPFLSQWERSSGIKLNVRYGDSAELAAQLLEEGANSPADLFLSQDAGSLGAIAAAELFTELPESVARDIPAEYIAANRSWVGVTGRARVFAYRHGAFSALPQSLSELTAPVYKGKLGIAPSNSSFQAAITALIGAKGEAFTEEWLRGLVANDVKSYLKNSAIVEAIDKNEISIGLTNHYYTWEVAEALGREIAVENGFFSANDLGNLINVSGVGILSSSRKISTAQNLISYLTSKEVQSEFVEKTHEYALIPGLTPPADLPALTAIGAPRVDLDSLKNIKVTQDLLIKVGLL